MTEQLIDHTPGLPVSLRTLSSSDAPGLIAVMRKSWYEQSGSLVGSSEGYIPPELIDATFPESPGSKRLNKSARDIARQNDPEDELMHKYIGAFASVFMEGDDKIVYGQKLVGFVKTGRPAADKKTYSGAEPVFHCIRRKLCGRINVKVKTKLEDPRLSEILELRVDSDYQGKGIGWGLLKSAVENLPEDAIETVRAFTGKDTRGFFRRCGLIDIVPTETRMYPNSEASLGEPGQIMYGMSARRDELLDKLSGRQ